MKDRNYMILVVAHKRPRFLGYVLESLKRQNELKYVQVWIDGHGAQPELRGKVEACVALRDKYPEAKWIVYGMHASEHKLVIDALTTNIDKFDKFIFFEEDSFPIPGSIPQYLIELDEAEKDDGIFSVYGDPREIPGEADGLYRFRAWAWATTATKLRRILPDLKALYSMPEPDFLDYIRENLTEEIRERLSEIPQINTINTLTTQFSYDSVLNFLTARAGLKHRPTSRRLSYNYGVGLDGTHFSSTHERFFKPPYNMITEQELIERFNLSEVDWLAMRRVECDKVYNLNSDSGEPRLLVSGWGEPESWGAWSVGAKSVIELGCDLAEGHDMQVTFQCKALVTPNRPVLKVACRVNEGKAVDWEFKQDSWQAEKTVNIPGQDWNEKRPAQIVFEIDRPVSPHELGLSDDRRAISLGVISLQLKQVPSPVAARA